MPINFADVTDIAIPAGDVTKITRQSDGVVLWEKNKIQADWEGPIHELYINDCIAYGSIGRSQKTYTENGLKFSNEIGVGDVLSVRRYWNKKIYGSIYAGGYKYEKVFEEVCPNIIWDYYDYSSLGYSSDNAHWNPTFSNSIGEKTTIVSLTNIKGYTKEYEAAHGMSSNTRVHLLMTDPDYEKWIAGQSASTNSYSIRLYLK
ncbi:MAG: hypothetical protein IJU98_08250 [Synergistaceae bacterium]|nr:hypothetical protein [Synergistaceae bacterium]